MSTDNISSWGDLKLWRRRLWGMVAAGLLIALAPFAIALAGLALDSAYLQTYHWLAYYSIPVGLGLIFLAGILAVVIALVARHRGSRR